MRPVAKFQLQSSTGEAGLADQVSAVVEAWAGQKFEFKGEKAIIRNSGREASYRREDTVSPVGARTTFEVAEPVDGGHLRTSVFVLTDASGVRVLVRLALGSDGASIAIPAVRLRSPRFIRQILQTEGSWSLDLEHDRIFAQPFRVDAENVDTFKQLLFSPHRRLPVVALSHLDGLPITRDLPAKLGLEVCGLAHTCEVNEEAAWAITRDVGREWSCFNGAVRLYWPGARTDGDFRAHPLWTYDWLLRKNETEQRAARWIRDEIGETLIEASSYLTEDPAFTAFDDAVAQARLDAARAEAAESNDYHKLADVYAVENDRLRAEARRQAEEIESLGHRLAALMYRSRSDQEEVASTGRIAEAPPETVAEAIAVARQRHGDWLALPDALDEQIATLSDTAGPPEKILRYLDTLAELSEVLQANHGSAGKSIPIWLRDRNVECSGESETTKASKAARSTRTWKINGADTYCELHLKPSDNAPPDRCVRIYFALADASPRVRIGYIGRHF